MLNEAIRDLFSYWYKRGLKEGSWDDGVKFFYFYLCLNILMANLSEERTDTMMLKWVKRNDSVIKTAFLNQLKNDEFRNQLELLKTQSPIDDSRPHSNKRKHLRDIKNMSEVLNVLYQVRCNFFHGNKPFSIPRNRDIVTPSTHILKLWMEEVLKI